MVKIDKRKGGNTMKLGVLTVALGDLPFEEACKFLAERGVQMVEIGCGGFPGKAHCDAAELLADIPGDSGQVSPGNQRSEQPRKYGASEPSDCRAV